MLQKESGQLCYRKKGPATGCSITAEREQRMPAPNLGVGYGGTFCPHTDNIPTCSLHCSRLIFPSPNQNLQHALICGNNAPATEETRDILDQYAHLSLSQVLKLFYWKSMNQTQMPYVKCMEVLWELKNWVGMVSYWVGIVCIQERSIQEYSGSCMRRTCIITSLNSFQHESFEKGEACIKLVSHFQHLGPQQLYLATFVCMFDTVYNTT